MVGMRLPQHAIAAAQFQSVLLSALLLNYKVELSDKFFQEKILYIFHFRLFAPINAKYRPSHLYSAHMQ